MTLRGAKALESASCVASMNAVLVLGCAMSVAYTASGCWFCSGLLFGAANKTAGMANAPAKEAAKRRVAKSRSSELTAQLQD